MNKNTIKINTFQEVKAVGISMKFLLFFMLLFTSTYALAENKEYDKAIEFFEKGQVENGFVIIKKLAKEGHQESQCDLFDLYSMGYEEIITVDENKSLFWLKKCASSNPIAMVQMGLYFYKQEDYTQAKRWLFEATKHSNSSAYLLLGDMYLEGKGFSKNCKQAFSQYKKSASLGNGDAANFLFNNYLHGSECAEKDPKKAKYWLINNAKLEFPSAEGLYRLGLSQLLGNKLLNIKENYKSAEINLNNASKLGHIDAIIALGEEYVKGTAFKKDYKKVFELFTYAAESNRAFAVYKLATTYSMGIGTQKNDSKACDLYQSSLEYVGSIYNLGICYANGTGRKKNTHIAFEYLLQAAEKGYVSAYIRLAMYYDFDITGMKNHKKAEYWYLQFINNLDYKKANKKNRYSFAVAKYNLSILYKYSNELKHNLQKSLKYLKESASLNFAQAQNDLGVYYLEVQKDSDKARKMYKKAAAQGNEMAKQNLEKLNNTSKGYWK